MYQGSSYGRSELSVELPESDLEAAHPPELSRLDNVALAKVPIGSWDLELNMLQPGRVKMDPYQVLQEHLFLMQLCFAEEERCSDCHEIYSLPFSC